MNTMRNRSFFQSEKNKQQTIMTAGDNTSTTTANFYHNPQHHQQQFQQQQQQQQQHNHHHHQQQQLQSDYFAVSSTDDADAAAGQKLFLLGGGSMTTSTTSGHVNNDIVNNFSSNPHRSMLQTYDSIAGSSANSTIASAPNSANTINTINTEKGHPTELEFTEDLITEPVLVLGVDITHMNPQAQFLICATGLFFFSLLYGYLQELLSVELCSRKLGLFLAMVQFSGYTGLAYFLRNFVYEKRKKTIEQQVLIKQSSLSLDQLERNSNHLINADKLANSRSNVHVPFRLYFGLSILRAIDLAMTNLAMQYINYPAKTLMKSSRIVFTMLFGVVIQRKKYKVMDYVVVAAMVAGLALFMHADATSSAVFHHLGVIMLTTSLTCDGAISNMSETMMSQYGIGQDEFIFRMYSIALLAISAAAAANGDLKDGFYWMFQPGTYAQYVDNVPLDERVWSVHGKVIVMMLFSSMGFFGSSCSAAITKNFGALTMSITSTARKATTLFLSFFLFNNVCTTEHLAGIILFISALTTKSMRRRSSSKGGNDGADSPNRRRNVSMSLLQKSKSTPNNSNSKPIVGNVVEVIQRKKEPAVRNNTKKRSNMIDKLIVAAGGGTVDPNNSTMVPLLPALGGGAVSSNLVHVV